LDSGAPGDAGFDPCHGDLGEPGLHFVTDEIEIGQRLYVYVCEFPEGLPLTALTAKVEQADTNFSQDVTVLPVPANPDEDEEKNDAQAVVEWPALPGQPIGHYVLSVATSGDEKIEITQGFDVKAPGSPHVLIVPEVGSPGKIFEVYYVFFELNTALDVALYGEDTPVEKQNHFVTGRDSTTVVIDQELPYSTGKGWAKQSLESSPDDIRSGYAVVFFYMNNSYKRLFWLK
jgi:hypothetical protein